MPFSKEFQKLFPNLIISHDENPPGCPHLRFGQSCLARFQVIDGVVTLHPQSTVDSCANCPAPTYDSE